MNTTTNARAYVAIFIGVLMCLPYIPLRGIPSDRAPAECWLIPVNGDEPAPFRGLGRRSS